MKEPLTSPPLPRFLSVVPLRTWIVVAVLLVMAAVAIWKLVAGDRAEPGEGLSGAAPGAAERESGAPQERAGGARPGKDETPRLWLEVGDRLTYSVHQNHGVKMSMITELSFGEPDAETAEKPLPPALVEPQTMETRQSMTGQVRMEVLAERVAAASGNPPVKSWLVEMSMTGLNMDMSIQGGNFPDDPEARRQLANAKDKLAREAMRSRVQAEVMENGEIGKIVATADSAEVRNQWRGVLSRWQVILPDATADSAWEREEQDETGRYIAGYEWRSAEYPRKLLKRKLRYTQISLASPGPALQPRHEVNGETHIVLEAYPVSIHGQEEKTLSSRGKGGFTVTGESRFSIELISAEKDPSLALRGADAMVQFMADTNTLAWVGEVDGGPPPASTPEEVEELIDLLRKTVQLAGGDSPQALNIAALLIKALKAGGPELVEEIMVALSDDYSDESFAMVLTGVLGAAGTGPSQKGLIEIVDTDDWPTELKEMAYTSMAQVSEPVEGLEDALIRQHEDGPEAYRKTALLMLAHAGHHLDGSDPERRAAVEAYIQGRIDDVNIEKYGHELSTALAVLGNLGPAEVPPLVRAAAQSEDPWVRTEALASLSRVKTEEATTLVLQGMRDEDESVRMTAVRTLGEHTPDGGYDALCALLKDEPSENVRQVAVTTLVNSYWGDDEGVRKLLTEISQADPSPDVRATAEEMIGFVGVRPWGTTDENGAGEGAAGESAAEKNTGPIEGVQP